MVRLKPGCSACAHDTERVGLGSHSCDVSPPLPLRLRGAKTGLHTRNLHDPRQNYEVTQVAGPTTKGGCLGWFVTSSRVEVAKKKQGKTKQNKAKQQERRGGAGRLVGQRTASIACPFLASTRLPQLQTSCFKPAQLTRLGFVEHHPHDLLREHLELSLFLPSCVAHLFMFDPFRARVYHGYATRGGGD